MDKHQIFNLLVLGLAVSVNAKSSLSPINQQNPDRTKIVGGKEVEPHSLPWQAWLESDGYACGGTILCSNFVMTAGHCAERKSVEVGLHRRSDDTEFQTVRSQHDVKTSYRHPDYLDINGYTRFDFAILELEQPIDFKPEAKALFLPTAADTEAKFDEKTVFVSSGWGKRREGYFHPLSDVLRSVSLPWISEENCFEAYQQNPELKPEITEDMICAGDLVKGKIDACQGDSGGPLAWLDPKTKEIKLIGAVSFGYGCARPNNPGVYSEVATVLDWINKVTDDCNEKTCGAGNCTTWDNLVEDARDSFKHVTDH